MSVNKINKGDEQMRTTTSLALVAVLAMIVASCSGTEDPVSSRADKSTGGTTTLNTFIDKSIEIDQLGATPPDDANLVVGWDGDSASAQKPPGGPAEFIDWDDLATLKPTGLKDHQIVDENNDKGKDLKSFPKSNECVGSSQVLSKMDLTYVASANNSKFAYIAVQRANNNGDAGYYWLFTKLEPKLTMGEAPCASDEERLTYDISGPDPGTGLGGDILLAGHFKPNGTPFLEVYRAQHSATGVSAVDAIDFTSTLWDKDSTGVAAVAVNTSDTPPGALGSAGVLALTKAGLLEPEIFAEAAIPMSVFTSGTPCDVTFYGTVITRSSGSGGTSPDLKDLAGPALFNFGGVKAEAKLLPSCDLEFGFQASATGSDDTPLPNVTCSWTFSNGETSNECSGKVTNNVSPGDYTGEVTITDPVTQCSKTIQTAPTTVYPELTVDATLTATCTSQFGFSADVQGGAGINRTLSWVFESTEGTIVSTTDPTKASGTATVGLGNVAYKGTVYVMEKHDGLECPAQDDDTATPYDPLKINIVLTGAAEVCDPTMSTDAVTYSAVPSGGNAVYNITWTYPGCAGAVCIVDPDDSDFCATATVQANLADTTTPGTPEYCVPKDSEEESYTKVTTVTATDKPPLE
jgi:hypothetical protein